MKFEIGDTVKASYAKSDITVAEDEKLVFGFLSKISSRTYYDVISYCGVVHMNYYKAEVKRARLLLIERTI